MSIYYELDLPRSSKTIVVEILGKKEQWSESRETTFFFLETDLKPFNLRKQRKIIKPTLRVLALQATFWKASRN